MGADSYPSPQLGMAPGQRDHTLPSGNVTVRSPDSSRGHHRSKGREDHRRCTWPLHWWCSWSLLGGREPGG